MNVTECACCATNHVRIDKAQITKQEKAGMCGALRMERKERRVGQCVLIWRWVRAGKEATFWLILITVKSQRQNVQFARLSCHTAQTTLRDTWKLCIWSVNAMQFIGIRKCHICFWLLQYNRMFLLKWYMCTRQNSTKLGWIIKAISVKVNS